MELVLELVDLMRLLTPSLIEHLMHLLMFHLVLVLTTIRLVHHSCLHTVTQPLLVTLMQQLPVHFQAVGLAELLETAIVVAEVTVEHTPIMRALVQVQTGVAMLI